MLGCRFRHGEIKFIITQHTSLAVEFKLELCAAHGVIDLFDPNSKLGLSVAVVGRNGHLSDYELAHAESRKWNMYGNFRPGFISDLVMLIFSVYFVLV
ncbi:hypothetical protein GEMRC1_005835 [Eukaryota sp. GEM-RC1]